MRSDPIGEFACGAASSAKPPQRKARRSITNRSGAYCPLVLADACSLLWRCCDGVRLLARTLNGGATAGHERATIRIGLYPSDPAIFRYSSSVNARSVSVRTKPIE